ncbi:MAG TPA: prolipoprotein diacylglyceryl transferase family protein [Humisphaera sp.]
MTFPYHLHLFGLALHPHPVLEVVGYTGGSQLYFWLRRRATRSARPALGPPVPVEANLWLIVGCVLGALVGAKALALAENWSAIRPEVAAGNVAALLAGKTIVGGILGGWVGVEVAKRRLGVGSRTGDLFVFPLCFGIAAGRVGCFLTGLDDHTHGVATALPWAVDFGDGVRRHPTQLYEVAWLAGLAAVLALPPARRIWSPAPGRLFRLFVAGYLSFRFAVEFIKPTDKPWLGLSAIQWASGIAVAVCVAQLARGGRASRAASVHVAGASDGDAPPPQPVPPA